MSNTSRNKWAHGKAELSNRRSTEDGIRINGRRSRNGGLRVKILKARAVLELDTVNNHGRTCKRPSHKRIRWKRIRGAHLRPRGIIPFKTNNLHATITKESFAFRPIDSVSKPDHTAMKKRNPPNWNPHSHDPAYQLPRASYARALLEKIIVISLDQVGALLANHINRVLDVAVGDDGYNRSGGS